MTANRSPPGIIPSLFFVHSQKEWWGGKKMMLPARLNLGILWKSWMPTLGSPLFMAVELFIYIHNMYHKCPPWKLQRFDEIVQKSKFLYLTDNLEGKIVVNKAMRYKNRFNSVSTVSWWPPPSVNYIGARIWWYPCLLNYISSTNGKNGWFFSRPFGALWFWAMSDADLECSWSVIFHLLQPLTYDAVTWPRFNYSLDGHLVTNWVFSWDRSIESLRKIYMFSLFTESQTMSSSKH